MVKNGAPEACDPVRNGVKVEHTIQMDAIRGVASTKYVMVARIAVRKELHIPASSK